MSEHADAHRAWTAAVALLAVAVAAYFQTFRELWPLWMDTGRTTYTHGVLVAAVSLWLAWRQRAPLRGQPIRPLRWMLLPVLLLSLAWLALARAGALTLHAALWPVLAFSILLAGTGWRVAGQFAFALAFLWFAVPVWDHVNGLLQAMTVAAVHALTVVTRVTAEIQGNFVILPQGVFEIAAGCSGLHFFMVALAIGALAGEIHRDSLKTRLFLLGVTAALAVVSNWLRVYFIILAGYLTDMEHYLVKVDHYKFGWVVFALAMLGFFFVLRRLPAREATDTGRSDSEASSRPWSTVVPALVAAAVLPVASWLAWQFATPGNLEGAAARPVEGFAGPLSPTPAWQPRFHGAALESRAAYLSPSGRVLDYYGNAYAEQRQGEELVGYRNHLFPPTVFKETSRRRVPLAEVGTGSAVELTVESTNGITWVALYQYDIDGRTVSSGTAAQLLGGFVSVWGPVASGIRVAAAPCGADCDDTRDELMILLARMARKSI